MWGQRGPSLMCKLCRQESTSAMHRWLRVDVLLFLNNQTAALHRGYFCNKSCQALPHFQFPLLCFSLLPPCYFSAVVRNDLTFFTSFHFFLSWWHLFISTSFCEGDSGRCCQIASFLRRHVMHVYTGEKMRRGLEWFPLLTYWKWMQRERVAVGC